MDTLDFYFIPYDIWHNLVPISDVQASIFWIIHKLHHHILSFVRSKIDEKLMKQSGIKRLPPILDLIFQQESFWHGSFITRTFRQAHSSALRTFWQMDISTQENFDMGTFLHREFSACGIFGTRTFGHRDISVHGHFSIVAPVPNCLCWNVHITLQGDKISMCPNVQEPKYPVPKHQWYRKFLVQKCPQSEKSLCQISCFTLFNVAVQLGITAGSELEVGQCFSKRNASITTFSR